MNEEHKINPDKLTEKQKANMYDRLVALYNMKSMTTKKWANVCEQALGKVDE